MLRELFLISSFNEIFDKGTTNIAFYKDSQNISWIIAKIFSITV